MVDLNGYTIEQMAKALQLLSGAYDLAGRADVRDAILAAGTAVEAAIRIAAQPPCAKGPGA